MHCLQRIQYYFILQMQSYILLIDCVWYLANLMLYKPVDYIITLLTANLTTEKRRTHTYYGADPLAQISARETDKS